MNKQTTVNSILTDETMRETAHHGSTDYPFCYYYENVWDFDFHCIDWHWHPEVEFVYVSTGRITCLIGSQRYILSAGQGIFINTQVIHRFEAEDEAILPNIVFSPRLLASPDSRIYQKYLKPILDSSVACVIFSAETKQGILATLQEIFALQEAEECSEIATVQLLLKLWQQMYDCNDFSERRNSPSAHKQAQLQMMMQFIHKNYSQQITLADIAKSVSVSKSSTLTLFKEYLHTTPVNYLINYRLKQAANLLITTDNTVGTIAQDTGFETTAYFCRQFKKLFRLTPGKYRQAGRKRTEPTHYPAESS